MAFVPHAPLSTTSLLPRGAPVLDARRGCVPLLLRAPRARAPARAPRPARDAPRRVTVASAVRSADAMEFFRHREGKWASWRVTHHLAFQRAESGESEISMTVLGADDERIEQLCRDWEVDPGQAQGGCYVTWRATMAWDQEGENHEGSTVFALVPEPDNTRKGRILRDRGYAEIVPIAGTYYLDDEDALHLETPYEGGAVEEKFEFDGINVVNRTSTVRRFGGLSTATFSSERRLDTGEPDPKDDEDPDFVSDEEAVRLMDEYSLFGAPPGANTIGNDGLASSAFTGRPRWSSPVATPSNTPATSAFSTGFSSAPAAQADAGSAAATSAPAADAGDANGAVEQDVQEMAEKAGIDLSKVPPSMREDFLASLKGDADRKSS